MSEGAGGAGGDRVRGDQVEGSLTDGGSLPGAGQEDRSFGAQRAHGSEPGRTGPQGEGGGAMSGRGQEEGGGWREQAEDAQVQAAHHRAEPGVGGGGVAGAGTGGAGLADDRSGGPAGGGLKGDAASGPGAATGPQDQGGARGYGG